jgi:hypothetical protein
MRAMSSIIVRVAAVVVAGLTVLNPESRACAQESAPVKTAVVGVTVVDVEAGRLVPGQTVVVEGETIRSMGPAASTPAPAGAEIVDGTGLFVIPGLIDSHIHYIDRETYGYLFIANGVTFVREMGNDTETALALRADLRSGELLGPDMIVTGAILDGDPPVWPFSEKCPTAELGRAAVRKLKERGVDQIKVYSRLPRESYLHR